MLSVVSGCANRSPVVEAATATTAPALAEPEPALAAPEHWFALPGRFMIDGADFDRLWRACEGEARRRLFPIDRSDRRGGVLTTEPVTSSQFFEPWRQDQATAFDTAKSSLGAMRRTIRFELTRLDDGRFRAVPKVLVERYVQAENRVTSVVLYRAAFRPARLSDPATPYGTRETDRGVSLPNRYWYAVGRDEELEQALADGVTRRLGQVAG
jgi:hypothetical protein